MRRDTSKFYVLPIATVVFLLLCIAYFLYGSRKNDIPVTTVMKTAATSTPEANLATLQCPEDYQTDDERTQSFIDFANDWGVLNPAEASDTTAIRDNEFTVARMDFYINHNCISTMEEYGYDGTSPITPTLRAALIENMEKTNQ